MHPAYFDTRFRTDQRISPWPHSFVIITAYATTGEAWSTAQNQLADGLLEQRLRARDPNIWRVIGYSPISGHEEPGWAAQLLFDEACDIGLESKQDAVYVVVGEMLNVSYCDERRSLVPVSGFFERLDAS